MGSGRGNQFLSKACPPRPDAAWPFGYGKCHCGCGLTTNTAPQKIKRSGMEKGEHYKWIVGHKKPSPLITLTCKFCGKVWEQKECDAAYGKRKYCSVACRNAAPKLTDEGRRAVREKNRNRRGKDNPNYKNGSRVGYRDREGERRFLSGQSSCQHPSCDGVERSLHQHHVVYRQHVKREGGDIWDPRNAIALCVRCHMTHHRRSNPLPIAALRRENIEFAEELFGKDAAGEYLLRRYSRSEKLNSAPSREDY